MKAKKILSLAISLIMLVCMVNVPIIADDNTVLTEENSQNITLGKYISEDTVYNLNDGDILTVTGQVKVQNGATLTINGGNIVVKDFNSAWAFYAGGGKIIFNGVNFKATNVKKYVVQADWGNSITFNDSTVTLTDVYCLFYSDPQAGNGILNLNNTKVYLKSGCNRVAQGTKAFVNLSNGSLIDADDLNEHAFRNVELTVDNSIIDINGCETGVKNDDGSKVTITGSSSLSVEKASASLGINLSNGSKMFATKDSSITLDGETYENFELITTAVAKVGDTSYETLTDAFNKATADSTVKLISDISIDYALTVKEDIILDLNGHTITAIDKLVKDSFILISVAKGKHLTVNDSVGTGEINLTATTDRDWNAQSTIFENRGSQLTINGGTFEHLGGTDMAFVVNVNANSFGDAVLNINDGTLESSYIAVRLFMDSPASNAGSGTAFVNVAGGEIVGVKRAIWAQAPNSIAGQTGEINITDGEIVGLIETARSTASVVETVVSGGTVDSFKVEAGELKITGGTVTGTLTVLDASGNAVESDEIITGGTFTNNLSAFVAEGYELNENEDGTFGVVIATKDIFGGKFAIRNMEMKDGYYRVVFASGIDSLKYKEVGFIFYHDGKKVTSVSTTKVYSSITVTNKDGRVQTVTAEDIDAYRIFFQSVLFDPEKWDDTPIEYQPYAITLDGETILGTIGVLDDIYTLDK